MLQFVFVKPIPIAELEGEMRIFARVLGKDGFDTVSQMMISLTGTKDGKPIEELWAGSDVPKWHPVIRKKDRVSLPSAELADSYPVSRFGFQAHEAR